MNNIEYFDSWKLQLYFLSGSVILAFLIVCLIDFYRKDWNKSSKAKKTLFLFLPISVFFGILKLLIKVSQIL